MAGKLFEQLQIGKAQADNFNPPQNLMRARLEHSLAFVDLQLVGSDELHCPLSLRNGRFCHFRSVCLCQNLLRLRRRCQVAQFVFGLRSEFASQFFKERILRRRRRERLAGPRTEITHPALAL